MKLEYLLWPLVVIIVSEIVIGFGMIIYFVIDFIRGDY